MNEKLLKNAIVGEQLQRFSRQEKHEIVTKLLKMKGCSQRKLAEEIGVSYSTLHDWVSLRQDNKGCNSHVSLTMIYSKLRNLDADQINDWGRIEMIKERCEDLLNQKQVL